MDDIKLVIFDMGGTTFEDAGQVPESFTSVLHAHGIEVTQSAVSAVRGASKREAIRSLAARQFPGDETHLAALTEQIYIDFREHLAERFTNGGVHLLPGAAETIAWLRRQGIRVALNTGFDRMITCLILRAVGWEEGTVDAVVCGEDVPLGRPAPFLIFRAMQETGTTSVHQVAVVGDTQLDLQAGWNAGVCWNIGVCSGAHTRGQLASTPHTHLLSGVANLPTLWEPIS
jgi:phosphonatase-like hydrolase